MNRLSQRQKATVNRSAGQPFNQEIGSFHHMLRDRFNRIRDRVLEDRALLP
jgi:hypothetical protein